MAAGKFRFRYIFVCLASVAIIASCIKIARMDDPNLNESFTGTVSIVPSITLYSPVETPTIVNLTGNGEKIFVSGLTGPGPLPLGLPKNINMLEAYLPVIIEIIKTKGKLDDESKLPSDRKGIQRFLKRLEKNKNSILSQINKLNNLLPTTEIRPEISGFYGKPLSPTEVEITGITGMNDPASELDPSVTGKLLLDGPSLYTPDNIPIEVTVNLRSLMHSIIEPWESLIGDIESAPSQTDEALGTAFDTGSFIPFNSDKIFKIDYSQADLHSKLIWGNAGHKEVSAGDHTDDEEREGVIVEILMRLMTSLNSEKINELIPADERKVIYRITFSGQIITPL